MQPDQHAATVHEKKRHRHHKHSGSRLKRKTKKRKRILMLIGLAATIIILALWLSAKSHIENNKEQPEVILDQSEEG